MNFNKDYAVIFDSDGVLVDSEPIGNRAVEECCKEFGLALTREDILHSIGIHDKRFVEYLNKKFNANITLAEFGERNVSKYIELAEGNVESFEGVSEFIDWLKESRISIAVASSSSERRLKFNLGELGFLEKFDIIISGDSVENAKPSPEIFIKTANILGFPRDKCIVIEDSLHGIQAAKSAGMYCIAITNTFDIAKLTPANPDAIITRIFESRALVEAFALTSIKK